MIDLDTLSDEALCSRLHELGLAFPPKPTEAELYQVWRGMLKGIYAQEMIYEPVTETLSRVRRAS